MTDIISKPRRPVPARSVSGEAVPAPAASAPQVSRGVPERGTSADLIAVVEMLFFAYRDFTGEADDVLKTYTLGRAHHRVLHFVNRNPGIRVADLLELLKITKQSLGRVLRRLIADGWVEQTPGPDDRRERRLTLTASGRDLANGLAALQTDRIGAALRAAAGDGAETQAHIERFLLALVSPAELATISTIVNGGTDALGVSVAPPHATREPHR
jgi:DNA-binding MarR family transcriptional regulator